MIDLPVSLLGGGGFPNCWVERLKFYGVRGKSRVLRGKENIKTGKSCVWEGGGFYEKMHSMGSKNGQMIYRKYCNNFSHCTNYPEPRNNQPLLK